MLTNPARDELTAALMVEVARQTSLCPETIDRSWNEGMDARHLCEPLNANPYGRDDPLRKVWRAAWIAVRRDWGRDARWPVRRLRVMPKKVHKRLAQRSVA
jgi:hypothetical protein